MDELEMSDTLDEIPDGNYMPEDNETEQISDEPEKQEYSENEDAEDNVDYAKRVEEDLEQIRNEFPALFGINDITDLKNPLRFGALRDLGLTAKEAFLASGGAKSGYDNRAHLTSSVPKRASSGIEMTRKEYEVAKDLFSDLSDSEIKGLYKRVTK